MIQYLLVFVLIYSSDSFEIPKKSVKAAIARKVSSLLFVPLFPGFFGAAKPCQAITPIPVKIDVDESIKKVVVDTISSGGRGGMLLPDVSIASLGGGGNLGLLLWSFVLYQGLFPQGGRPADWCLPLVVRILPGFERDEQWYKDYLDGYEFVCPPAAEAIRTLLFLGLGYFANLLVLESFDCDTFWCWSIAGSLSLPAGLIALARQKPKKREIQELEERIVADFSEFAQTRLTRVRTKLSDASNFKANMKETNLRRDKNCVQEDSIVLAFRRQYMSYRDDTSVPDKLIRKGIRKVVGYKPYNGYYLDLRLYDARLESRRENRRLVQEANAEREALIIVLNDNESDDEMTINYDNENLDAFVRR